MNEDQYTQFGTGKSARRNLVQPFEAAALPGGWFFTSIKLKNGEILEKMVVNDRGYIIGKIAAGLAGAHGDMDASMITFSAEDVEAVQAPAFHFWQRPKWIQINK